MDELSRPDLIGFRFTRLNIDVEQRIGEWRWRQSSPHLLARVGALHIGDDIGRRILICRLHRITWGTGDQQPVAHGIEILYIASPGSIRKHLDGIGLGNIETCGIECPGDAFGGNIALSQHRLQPGRPAGAAGADHTGVRSAIRCEEDQLNRLQTLWVEYGKLVTPFDSDCPRATAWYPIALHAIREKG